MQAESNEMGLVMEGNKRTHAQETGYLCPWSAKTSFFKLVGFIES
jgi:hypothetical protein